MLKRGKNKMKRTAYYVNDKLVLAGYPTAKRAYDKLIAAGKTAEFKTVLIERIAGKLVMRSKY